MQSENAAARMETVGHTIEVSDLIHRVYAHMTNVRVELKINRVKHGATVASAMGTVDAFDKAVRMILPNKGVVLREESKVEFEDQQAQIVRVVVPYQIGTDRDEFRATGKDVPNAYLLAVLEAAAHMSGGIILK